MRKTFVTLLILLVSVSLTAQPWYKYYTPSKSGIEAEDYKAVVEAFNTYWKDKDPGHGTGYKPFMRWAWMIGERIGGNGKIRSDILWQEYLKQQNKMNGKGGPLDLGNWQFLGPDITPTDLGSGQVIGSGRIDCIAFHPKDTNIIYAGSPTGGLWKTADNGNSWVPLTDNLPGLGIADIAIHPLHPDTLFIGTGDRDAGEIYAAGVLKSYNGGISWHSTALSFSQSDNYVINRLLINPINPDTIIAATNKGIYLLTNNADSSVKVLDGHFKDLEFNPGNPDIVYAASYKYGGATVYKSTDGGKTFTESSTGMLTANIRRIDLAVTPARPDMVMAICSDKESSGLQAVYRSFNQGSNWTTLLSGGTKNILATEPDGTGTGGQGWYDLAITISPDNYAEIYTGGVNIWKTLNGGGSWQLSTFGYPEWGISSAAYVHVDQHILKTHPVTGAVYSGNDGGIYRSYDKGNTWNDITNNLGILQIYRLGSSPQKRSLILMGSQDNSSIMTTDTNWYVVIGGDGMECIVDYTDTNTLYVSSQYGNLGRSDDGGFTFRSITPDGVVQGAWITPYIMHPQDPKRLFAGYDEIYETTNGGDNWKKLTSGLSLGKNYSHLAISEFNPDVLYATTGSNCWRSDNHGKSWTNIRNGLGSGTVRYFAIHQYDAHTVWAALSNYSAGEKVYFSEDGGSTWVNYSEGLPNVPVNCLVFQNNSNNTLYAGTDLGVYYRNRSMSQWKPFSKNLPDVIVNELEIYYKDSLIRAATYGRGLWESPVSHPDTAVPFADFYVNKLSSCLGSTFDFYYKGIENPDSLRWIFGSSAIPETIANQDTASVEFTVTGQQDISLVVYKNGLADTLTRKKYVNSVSSIDPYITSDFDTYFWRGNIARLEAHGADTYTWSPAAGLDTTSGAVVYASPDTTITYYVTAVQGICQGKDSILIDIYPNDYIRYALPLQIGTNGPFINYGASVEENEPVPPAGGCNTQSTWCDEFGTGKDILGHTVWFTFTGPASGVISIDSRGFDEQIAVYSANNPDSLLYGTYSLLAANDDYHGETEYYAAAITEITGITEGKTYWVQVDGSAGNIEGEFYLDLFDSPLGIDTRLFSRTGNEIDLYPNPNKGSFMLHFNTVIHNHALIRVYSVSGHLVLEKEITGVLAGENLQIQADHLSPGMYLLTVTADNELWKARFIVQ